MIRPQSKRVPWTAAHKRLKTLLNQYPMSVQELRWHQKHTKDAPYDLEHLMAECLKQAEAKEASDALGRSAQENQSV